MDQSKIIKVVRQARNGDAPLLDGPRVEKFDVREVASAIESEYERAKACGWTKISLHMDLQDALQLAKVLRKAR